MLIAEAVKPSAVLMCGERVVSGRDRAFVDCVLFGRVGDLFVVALSVHVQWAILHIRGKVQMYPEINIQIPAPTEFSIANLEGDGHFVVRVQLFVEAFSRVGFELDVVRGRGSEERQGGSK
jgi:hypothetical protein